MFLRTLSLPSATSHCDWRLFLGNFLFAASNRSYGKPLIWTVAFEFLSQDASVKICSSCMVETLGTGQSDQMPLKPRAGIRQSWLSEIWSPNCVLHLTGHQLLRKHLHFFLFYFIFEMYLFVCKHVYLYLCIRTWTWHDACVERKANLWELVLPFYYVGPGDQTQFFRFGSMYFFFVCFYLLSHLACSVSQGSFGKSWGEDKSQRYSIHQGDGVSRENRAATHVNP